MTFSFHLFNTFNSHSPFHCSGNSFHSSYTAKFCPTTRVTASPSVLLSVRKWSKLAGTAQWVQQTGSWPMAQQKQIASLANGATQMQILTLKRQYFSQRSSRASLWEERKRGTTDVSKVCICWHLNQVISCTRNIKLTTEAKLLLICYF